MSEKTSIRIPGSLVSEGGGELPTLLRPSTSRGAGGKAPALPVEVEAVYDLSPGVRGEAAEAKVELGDALVALEAADGTTMFVRADRLRERLVELGGDPEDLDLSLLRDPTDETRSAIGSFIWSKLTRLRLTPDSILEGAKERLLEELKDKLTDQLGDRVEELFSVSTLGARVLMHAVEKVRLKRGPGLYRWSRAGLAEEPTEFSKEGPVVEPMLVFIHGTGSSTELSFKPLFESQGSSDVWDRLESHFPGGVFGFEHHSFSDGPVDNALELAKALPEGADVSLVTYSRGGMIGDLLSVNTISESALRKYEEDRSRPTSSDGRVGGRSKSDSTKALEAQYVADEVEKLRQLSLLVGPEGKFKVSRYVRVAAPVRGTTLITQNLDVFLSGLLSLLNSALGAITGGSAGLVLEILKRLTLEVAERRLDPRLVPGIEAMLPGSPMTRLLAQVPPRDGLQLAVIAGDVESSNPLGKLALMFTDWMLFSSNPNDFVVDTASMLGGIGHSDNMRVTTLNAHHLSYFGRNDVRMATVRWLTEEDLEKVKVFEAPPDDLEEIRRRDLGRGIPRSAIADPESVVILLPGIMGSHLELDRKRNGEAGSGNRIWLDIKDLVLGGLQDIGIGKSGVYPEGLLQGPYASFAEYLQGRRIHVEEFPYDWRSDLFESASRLDATIERLMEAHPLKPIRFVAHSMGGLLARAFIAQHADRWDTLVRRRDARLVMLGTPNNGSHMVVETLLGKGATIRKLATFDVVLSMQQILQIISAFPGVLQLLPRPSFIDDGRTEATYLDAELWREYGEKNHSFWFGRGLTATPTDDGLVKARSFWNRIDFPVPHQNERVAYVYGHDEKNRTPCGLEERRGRLKMLGTTNGDGSVTWTSGQLRDLRSERYWYMRVEHGAMADSEAHFGGIMDLFETGTTRALDRRPTPRGDTEAVKAIEDVPELYPSEEEVYYSLMRRNVPRRRRARAERMMKVQVMGMDLKNAPIPVMCGHYLGDPMAGPEALIDEHLVGGGLRQRVRLDLYPGPLNTSTVVLSRRTGEDEVRQTWSGAVVVGLGEFGNLTSRELRETVRSGVKRFLLRASEFGGRTDEGTAAPRPPLHLGSMLIGVNSTTSITPKESIDAIVMGVCQADEEFNREGPILHIDKLSFVELYTDTAISASYAVRALREDRKRELVQLGLELDVSEPFQQHDTMKSRLTMQLGEGYWPRVLVTSSDPCAECEAESSEPRRPRQGQLKYVYLSERARAEAVVQQTQPKRIERYVDRMIGGTTAQPEIGRNLFHLMVPRNFKSVAREMTRMVLVVDEVTANYPWEMIQSGDKPIVTEASVVRQLISTNRPAIPSSVRRSACVVADPSLDGVETWLDLQLPQLRGAAEEGAEIADLLRSSGYAVTFAGPNSSGANVLSAVFESHRILAIAAHGVFQQEDTDGLLQTGVVLDDGVLTATELAQMETLPELVFLNCCHLGRTIDGSDPREHMKSKNRLAASISSTLIENGVRCVVAAGWAVDDGAAKVFATRFFGDMLKGVTFGDAIKAARKATWDRSQSQNTWGAYQAYGDPQFVLEPTGDADDGDGDDFITAAELIDRIDGMRRAARDEGAPPLQQVEAEIKRLRNRSAPEWLERGDVQEALGHLYAEYKSSGGTGKSIEAYRRAIGGGTNESDYATIRSLEQLANMEARVAGNKLDQKATRSEAWKLLNSALTRLRSLEPRLASEKAEFMPWDLDTSSLNSEQSAVLGSTLKRAASVHNRDADTRAEVISLMEKARNAYLRAETKPGDPKFEAYQLLNRIQLDVLLTASRPLSDDELIERKQLVQQSIKATRQQFTTFWEAVGVANAELTIEMLDTLIDRRTKIDTERLLRRYHECIDRIPRSQRTMDSTIDHIRILSELWRIAPAEADHAKELEILADKLAKDFGSAQDGNAQAKPIDAKPAAKSAKAPRAKKSQPRKKAASRKPTPKKAPQRRRSKKK